MEGATCASSHHTLLQQAPSSTTETAKSNRVSVNFTPFNFDKSVLRTILADVKTDHVSQTAKILFDEGSEISLISSRLARSLEAKLTPFPLTVDGVGSAAFHSRYATTVSIHCSNSKLVSVNCHVMEPLNSRADLHRFKHQLSSRGLKPWADPTPSAPTKVDLIRMAAIAVPVLTSLPRINQ